MDHLNPNTVDGTGSITGPTGTAGEPGVLDCGPGVPGTDISAEVLNPMRFEIVNAIKAAGITPNGNDWTQLAQAITAFAAAALPAGFITLYRVTGAIPVGWALCDGQNGTPDLRDRFVIGAGLNYGSGQAGGTLAGQTTGAGGSHSHTVSGNTGLTTLTEAQLPAHSHNATSNPHSHGLTMDPHNHTYSDEGSSGSRGVDNDTDFNVPSSHPVNNETTANATSTGTIADATATVSISNTGGGEGHAHGLSIASQSAGSHTHTVPNPIPPYYGLRYIMKL